MVGSRKCHPEQCNPITKECTWYALTDKQMLAQKFKINKLIFIQPRKLKKKEDLSEGALVPLTGGLLTGTIREAMCGAETEVRATQGLCYLGIHPINRHQTQHY